MKERQFKCAFKHCAHPDQKVSQSEAVRVGNRYWHKECREISCITRNIVSMWEENISKSVVYQLLMKKIVVLVHGKKLENRNLPKYESDLEAARYLEFALEYAIRHGFNITHVNGLDYLIDNNQIKKAYKKVMEKKTEKEMHDYVTSDSADSNESPLFSLADDYDESKAVEKFGFGKILKDVEFNE